MTASSFFTVDGDWFVGTDAARGPWDADACHAGPPAGLVARALERITGEHRLVRLTVELSRPIPMDGFRVEAEVMRSGRSVTTTRAAIVDRTGETRITALAVHLAPRPPTDLPTVHWGIRDFGDAEPGLFPIRGSQRGLPGFSTGVEIRYPPGQGPSPGPTTAWMRTVPLLPDEEPSPFQRICPLADCGNAIGRNAELSDASFINPDLTIVIHREPVGEWFGIEALSHWQADGIGMADALLFDTEGAVGRALQTLLIRPAG
jgi:hypothetical protein